MRTPTTKLGWSANSQPHFPLLLLLQYLRGVHGTLRDRCAQTVDRSLFHEAAGRARAPPPNPRSRKSTLNVFLFVTSRCASGSISSPLSSRQVLDRINFQRGIATQARRESRSLTIQRKLVAQRLDLPERCLMKWLTMSPRLVQNNNCVYRHS